MSPRWEVSLPIVLLVFSVLVHLWMPDALANLTAGIFLGAMVSLLHRLGGQHRRAACAGSHRSGRSGRPAGSPETVPGRCPAPVSVFAGFLLAMRRRPGGGAGAVTSRPILVLFPYEGTYEPGQPPRKVVLRESDYQRLQGHGAAPGPRADPSADPDRGDSSRHPDRRAGRRPRERAVDPRPLARDRRRWKLPVAGAREISATLDGSPVPVFIEGGGKQASIPIAGPRHRCELLVRRTAAARQGRPGGIARFPGQSSPLSPPDRRRGRALEHSQAAQRPGQPQDRARPRDHRGTRSRLTTSRSSGEPGTPRSGHRPGGRRRDPLGHRAGRRSDPGPLDVPGRSPDLDPSAQDGAWPDRQIGTDPGLITPPGAGPRTSPSGRLGSIPRSRTER